jgi:CBS domain-containing protein
MNVQDILTAKKAKTLLIKPTDTIRSLCDALRAHRVGAAVVSSDGSRIDGIITERDVTYALAQHGGDLAGKAVSEFMTRAVITCAPTDDPGRVASAMLSRNFRHIPVADNGLFVGMVSIRDVLKERVDELQQQTAHMRTLSAQMDGSVQDR